MALLDRIEHVIEMPDGVNVSYSDGVATVSGENGSISRTFVHDKVQVLLEGGAVMVRVDIPRRKERP